MSGNENNKNANEKLILSANATNATAGFPLKTHNNNNCENIKSTEKHLQNQLHEQYTISVNNKLPTEGHHQPAQQQQQQQQRRALLPPPFHRTIVHHQEQQRLITTSPTNNFNPQLNQLQTVATIHHQQSQQQQQQHQQQHQQQYQGNLQDTKIHTIQPPTTTAIKQQQQQQQQINKAVPQTEQSATPGPLLPPTAANTKSGATTTTTSGTTTFKIPINTRRSLNQLKLPKNHSKSIASQDNTFKGPIHSIPPSYQPPPQVQPSANCNFGILKNIDSYQINPLNVNGNNTSNGTSANTNKYFEDSSQHLKLKYPPDIPQLSTVCIPDTYKTQTNKNRLLQQQQQQQQQQQHHQQQQQRQFQHQLNQQLNTQQNKQDMLKFVRKPEQDHPSPNTSVTSSGTGIPTTASTRLTVEQNRQLQSLINELRALKEQNQRLLDDNQELRDLCCFLDDDRQKGRKLAREWQRFGRYTASVMRQEVAAYQNKLRQLDDKQQELITDNLELKELCLYLDEERAHIAVNALCSNCGASTRNNLRDDGDGSSSTTNFEHNYDRQITDYQLRTSLNDQTLLYVRSLERRIQQLEEERVATATTTTTNHLTQKHQQQQKQQHQHQQQQQQQPKQVQQQEESFPEPLSGRPEAVVRALQVLEVREQLERDRLGTLSGNVIDQMDDGEKALVREMCNVVWRKLEGNPNGPSHSIEPI